MKNFVINSSTVHLCKWNNINIINLLHVHLEDDLSSLLFSTSQTSTIVTCQVPNPGLFLVTLWYCSGSREVLWK